MSAKPRSHWQQRRRQEAEQQRQYAEMHWRRTQRYDDLTLWWQLGEWLEQHPRLEDLPPHLAPLLSASPAAQDVREQWAAMNLLPVTPVPPQRWILRSDWRACLTALEQRLPPPSPYRFPEGTEEEES